LLAGCIKQQAAMSGDRMGGTVGHPAVGPARELESCRPQAGGIRVDPENQLRPPANYAIGEAVAKAAAGGCAERRRSVVDGLRCVSHAFPD
jgi:hypothetical protein